MGMVEPRGGHPHVLDLELGAVVQLTKGNAGARAVEGNGKKGRVRLRGKHTAQVLIVALAGIDKHPIAIAIEWRKEWQALDVIPVGMADQNMRLPFARLELGAHEFLAQPPYPSSAVDDDAGARCGRDFNARGVPPVALSAGAWNGKRAADTPEAYSHGYRVVPAGFA